MAKNTTQIGRRAELIVARHLEKQGWTILDLNWKRPDCEIDIVATRYAGRFRRQQTLAFIEVKYRRSSRHGTGLESISHSKIKQIHHSAERYIQEHDHDGLVLLLAAEVDSSDKVTLVELG